ncbi:extracellular solute-binding protein [Anaerolineae bacterium CFX9]|nr:extracellular solute-binding protein [Anaerolineae bacterium CFX9]
MFRKQFVFAVSILLIALMGVGGVVAQDDTFMGMTAEQLFPGAQTDLERTTAMAALQAANLPVATDRFAGQTLIVSVQQAGPRGGISGPYYFWRDAFQALTGATLEIVEIPQAQYYTTTATDFIAGQNTYDVMNIGGWYMGDYVSNGWIQPIDSFIGQEGYPVWEPDQVAPPIYNLLQWNDQLYATVNDGDAQMLYFRKDILEDPEWQAQYEAEMGEPMPYPIETWQQLLRINQFFSGKDWNGDGDPDDGISLHLRSGGQGHFHFVTVAASFAITPAEGDDPRRVTQYDNVFWFDPTDMTALANSPGHVAALEYLLELTATGSPSQTGWELAEAWANFLQGNAIATFSWGDVGSLAQRPDRSTIQGLLGAARIPCSEVWYDREAGMMMNDPENPNCIGNVTGGSWMPVMSSFTDTPELAYYFMAMHANRHINFWNATAGWTGVDPASLYQLFPPRGSATLEDYTQFGFNASDAEQYITAYGENMFSFATTLPYLRIPGTERYWNSLDVRLAEVMTGQREPQAALDLVAQEWEVVTDDIGRDVQLAVYQQAIGYAP